MHSYFHNINSNIYNPPATECVSDSLFGKTNHLGGKNRLIYKRNKFWRCHTQSDSVPSH